MHRAVVRNNTGVPLDSLHQLNQQFIVAERLTLAATAWAGFERVGRGVLLVDMTAELELNPGDPESVRYPILYLPAAEVTGRVIPADLLGKMRRSLELYAPTTGVVIAIKRPDDLSYYSIRLTPTPPEAYIQIGDQIHEAERQLAFLRAENVREAI